MTPREELEALRRIAELERKAGLGASAAPAAPVRDIEADDANAFAGQDVTQMGAFERGLGGAKHAIDRAAYGVKSLMPQVVQDAGDWVDRKLGMGGLNEQDVRQGEAFVKKGGTAAKVGEIGTDVGMMLAPGGATTQALRVGTRALPRVLGMFARGGGELASGAGLGAITAMPGERGTGAMWGAGGSALGMGVSRLLGGAVKPAITPEARALMDQGIQPSIGQMVGGGVNKLEERAMSVPFIGNAIGKARSRAVNEFNERALQTAVPGSHGFGDEAIGAARDAISRQYDEALSLMPARFTVDPAPVASMAQNAVSDAGRGLSEASQQRVMNWVGQNLLQRNGEMTPEIAKRVESDMGKLVQRWRHSLDGEERAMGDALSDVHSMWRQSLTDVGSMNGNRAGRLLRDADAQYRAFDVLDTAAAGAGAQGAEAGAGTYTPKMLRRAIERADKSKNNRTTRFGRFERGPAQQAAGEEAEQFATSSGRTPVYEAAGEGQRMLPGGRPALPAPGPGVPAIYDDAAGAVGGARRPAAGGSGGQGGPTRPARPLEPPEPPMPPAGPSRFDQINDLTRNAEQSLSGRTGDSGTAGRNMVGATLGYAGAGVVGLPLLAKAIAAQVAANVVYTRGGQRFAAEGVEPLVRAALGRGATAQQVIDVASRYGPAGLLALSRGGAASMADK